MYIVGFNGPPRSGKDTIASFLSGIIEDETGIQPQTLSLSMPMRLATYALMGQQYDGTHYHTHKDEPMPLFGGKSIREVMIALSETFVKPTYGNEFWAARLLQDRWKDPKPKVVLIPDIGFPAEVAYLCNNIDTTKFLLVRVHRDGYDWANDSRRYVTHASADTTVIFNNGHTLDDAMTEARRLYGRLVNQFGWKL